MSEVDRPAPNFRPAPVSSSPVSTMRTKVEINTREHFAVLPIEQYPFVVGNPWFSGTAALPVYHLDELLGTKMRALYQRGKEPWKELDR